MEVRSRTGTTLVSTANYEGPLYARMASMPPPTGELLAWDPVQTEGRLAREVSSPGRRRRARHRQAT